MTNEVPLIYTAEGNLPIAELAYATRWERTDGYIALVETYSREGRVVRQSKHVFGLKPLDIDLLQEQVG